MACMDLSSQPHESVAVPICFWINPIGEQSLNAKALISVTMASSHICCICWCVGFVCQWKLQHHQRDSALSFSSNRHFDNLYRSSYFKNTSEVKQYT